MREGNKMFKGVGDILGAVKLICKEKGLSVEAVLSTIEYALAAAYRKDFGQKNQNIKAEFNPQTGEIKVFDVKLVVDYEPEEIEEDKKEPSQTLIKKIGGESSPAEVIEGKTADKTADETEGEEKKKFNPKFHLTLEEAKKIKKGANLGDEIITELKVPAPFGRMAAQTAKQVIIQRLKEAERDVLFEEYKEKEGKIVNGVVQRRGVKGFLIDLGKAVGILTIEGQIRAERYSPGQKIKVFIVSVNQSLKGPEIIVSRTHPDIIRELFNLEIPEIANKTVEIKAIAREAGFRSKVAVLSNQENLDSIGACIGQRGARIQTIIAELSGEKIDIVEYSEDIEKFIINALSPAKILEVKINDKQKTAKVKVKEDQFSLAIGKSGQNVRLASQLTGWAIEIEGEGGQNKKDGEQDEEDGKEKEAKENKGEQKSEKRQRKKKSEKSLNYD